jgi:hypothetical protein
MLDEHNFRLSKVDGRLLMDLCNDRVGNRREMPE